MTDKPNEVRVSRELIETAIQACFEAGHGITHDELRALLAQPADPQGEPVAWLITLIDAGSTYCITEDKLRADRLIADSDYVITPLYRHAQPATAKVDERAEFEAWYGSDDESGLGEEEIRSWRKGDRYSNQYERCNICWVAWQARAKLNGGQS